MGRKRRQHKFDRRILLVPVVFVIALLWVWKANEADKLSREYTRLERTKKSLAEKNKSLLAQLEKYRSIAWIDSKVRSNYKMTYEVKNRLVLFDEPVKKPKPRWSLMADIGGFLGRVFSFLTGNR